MVKLAGAVRSLGRGLSRLGGRMRRFGVDAVTDTRRRKAPVSQLRSEDAEQTANQRGQEITLTRDINRNFEVAAWAIRKHLDYVATFAFQARTRDAGFNARLEELMTWWMRARNCDVAARHPLRRIIRIAEAGRTLAGDHGIMKLADGRLQGIEADRIRTPTSGAPTGLDLKSLTHGVQTDGSGRALKYCVCKRKSDLAGGFEFERLVPAENMILHGYWGRVDQVRGAGLVRPGINRFRDTYEGLEYALAKAKLQQAVALALFRDESDEVGEESTETGDSAPANPRRDFGKAPLFFDLPQSAKLELVESRNPSNEFRDYMNFSIAMALKSVDIPFSFYDESITNYSGSRGARIDYDQSAEDKRDDNRDLLHELTAWRLGLWIADGYVVLPRSWTLADVRWEWVSKGVPWIDMLKEVQADGKAVEFGFDSPQRIVKRQGGDAFDIIDEQADWYEYRRLRGLRDPAFDGQPIPIYEEPPRRKGDDGQK